MLFLPRYASAVLLTRGTWHLCNPKEIRYTMEKSTDSLLKKKLSDWHFLDSKLITLPLEITRENYVRRNVKDAIFSVVLPTPLKSKLKLVSYSEDALVSILDMDPSIAETCEFLEFVSGNKILPSSIPLAHRYGGHQFGFWAMQLGDGRAHLLGEYVNRAGERWELQLKGSGKTPYSRDADGRAVLRSSIREFLCSEAMYYLGIPTSRAAAIVVSDDPVVRDQFYNGFPKTEKAAVVLRLAPSWFRFGSLEILAHNKELISLKKLLDFILIEHYSQINPHDVDRYVELFRQIAHKTIDLTVCWQSVGFVHGVLNTDNMSMLGITIDYGPFGFVEAYNPQFVPNYSDKQARYCYKKQLEIAEWNLEKLSRAFIPLLDESQIVQVTRELQNLGQRAAMKMRSTFRKKLGLHEDMDDADQHLITLLLQIMEESGADFTQTFRQLGEISLTDLRNPEALNNYWSLKKLSSHVDYPAFTEAYLTRIEAEEGLTDAERKHLMCQVNPRYVLRNWMAESAIKKAEKDDFSEVQFLLKILQSPYTSIEEAEKKGYADPPPKWACTISVSCSS